ncbi:phospholipid carrier-dependent glycosyltransferase [Paenibacillus arenilitoris]|uniref:Phospholipid carrier-dependent glycosyltransferase n=1 Tax=Paenibacillus arenilitoris TaxID=2772299 RepID=A0A927CLD2_9BACL|nr:phospholipid carrier-dependent glycosyltransferase [Paenibacillus arenilitoris]MBD2868311.1 phospholipid carrier-dependent glycosyltransferase [Paenibacillus arenilitoris]
MLDYVRKNKAWTIAIVLIFLLAFWLRADFLTSVKHNISHDTKYYNEMVHRLLDKGIYSYKEEVPNARVTPGYPLFMTAMYLVADQIGVEPFPLIRWVQVLISLASLALMYMIAMQATKNKWVALLTIFVGAIYHPFIWTTGAVLTETLALFLLMGYLSMQLYAFRTQRKRDAALAGILLGLTVLVRAEFLPLFVPLYGLFLLQQWRQAKEERGPSKLAVFKKVALLGIITGLCLSATMLPWWIRNVVTLGEFVLTASQSNPFSAGTYPNKDYTDRIVPKPKEMSQEEYAWARLKAGFTTQTWTYVKWYTVGKLKYTYSHMFFGSGHSPIYHAYPNVAYLHILVVYSTIITLLGLLWRWRHPAAMLAVVIVIMSMIRLVFVPEYRYNFTVMPLFIILSTWLGVYVWQKLWAYARRGRAA